MAHEYADCKSYLANSLFVFGEFGGNDYNAMLFGNYNADQASTYTPQIVSTIANGIEVRLTVFVPPLPTQLLPPVHD
jgi:hypothetical protein